MSSPLKKPMEDQGYMKKFTLAVEVVLKLKNFPTYFLDYLKKTTRKSIVYKFRNGLKFKVRAGTSDRNILNEVFIEDFYEKEFNVKRGDVVVDIGANIGAFTILAAGKKAGKVYSFEPFKQNYELLKQNVALNSFTNVDAINKAVYNKEGEKKLILAGGGNFGGNSFAKDHWQTKESENYETVKTISLNKFLTEKRIQRIDILKIDCEGSEYEILFNASKKTLSKIKKITMEFHNFKDNKDSTKLVEFLKENQFEVKHTDLELPTGMLYAINKIQD